jgi:hypothetical protein
MSITLEISTKNYSDDLLSIKKALSHMETLVGVYNGYLLGEPTTNFGWTFFKITFKPELRNGIEEKFSDMLSQYRFSSQQQKFAKFMADYFSSKNCKVKIKAVD